MSGRGRYTLGPARAVCAARRAGHDCHCGAGHTHSSYHQCAECGAHWPVDSTLQAQRLADIKRRLREGA